jgi:adenosylmethionine-8-amino-7-oxononanoate aminotransferase
MGYYYYYYYYYFLVGTYGGNAVSCAAALAVLEIFKQEDILGNTMAREQQMRDRLHGFFGSD